MHAIDTLKTIIVLLIIIIVSSSIRVGILLSERVFKQSYVRITDVGRIRKITAYEI